MTKSQLQKKTCFFLFYRDVTLEPKESILNRVASKPNRINLRFNLPPENIQGYLESFPTTSNAAEDTKKRRPSSYMKLTFLDVPLDWLLVCSF